MYQQTPLPLDTTSSTDWKGGLVGLGADLDVVSKRKFPALVWKHIPSSIW